MAAIAKVLVAVALMFGTAVGTGSATQESLPGSLLYPVKLQYEDWQLAAAQDLESKTELAIKYAQKRVEETERLVEQSDGIPEELPVRYQHQVSLTLQTMQMLDAPAQLQMRTSFSGTLQNHLRVMERLMYRINADPAQDHIVPTRARIQAMMQTMLQAQQELGRAEHHGGTAGPGPHPGDNGNGSGGQCTGDCGDPNDRHKDDDHHGQGTDGQGGSCDTDNGCDSEGISDKGSSLDSQCTGDCGGHDDRHKDDDHHGQGTDGQDGSCDDGKSCGSGGTPGDGGGSGNGGKIDEGHDGRNNGGHGDR